VIKPPRSPERAIPTAGLCAPGDGGVKCGKTRRVPEPVAEVEVVVAASPARVWRALEAAGLTGWLCERASGALEVGGQLALGWPSLGLEAELAVVEVDPERRLVLAGTGAAAAERQETVLREVAGGTRVAVRHSGFADSSRGHDRAAGSAAGWRVALAMLDLYLGGREDRQLSGQAAVGTVAVPAQRLWPEIGEAVELARWLGPVEGDIEREGDSLVVTLGGRRHEAHVLCRAAPYELALTLPALDAVLRLRLVGIGGATLVCLHLVGWDGDARLAPLGQPLVAALDRLLSGHGGGAVA
jgi:uncharacterized protein YndB with AHSA1/START domain